MKRAGLVEEADLMQIEAYLKLFPSFRVRLAVRLQHRTWLAYPANASDARQRLGKTRPVLVHLVEQSAAFEQILARWDGSAWWFESDDRRDDPRFAEYLRKAFKKEKEPEALRWKGLTPEMRTVASPSAAPLPTAPGSSGGATRHSSGGCATRSGKGATRHGAGLRRRTPSGRPGAGRLLARGMGHARRRGAPLSHQQAGPHRCQRRHLPQRP